MLVAQISDLHVAPEGSFMRQFVDSNELLARAVTYLNTMTPRPDVVLATGDLTDHGTAESCPPVAGRRTDLNRAGVGEPPSAASCRSG